MYSKAVYVSLFLASAHLGSATYDMYQVDQEEYPETLSSLSASSGGYRPTGISATGTVPIGTSPPILPTYTSDYDGGFSTTSGYEGIPTDVPVPSGNGGKCTMDSCGDLSAIGWQITCAQTADSIPTQPPQPTGTGGGYNPQPSGGYGGYEADGYRMRRKRMGGNYNHNNEEHGYGAGSFDGRPICYKYIYDCDPNDEEVSAPEQYPCYKYGDDKPSSSWAYGTGNWPKPSVTKESDDGPMYAATTGVEQPTETPVDQYR